MRPDEHFREVLFPHLSFSTFLKWKYAVEVAEVVIAKSEVGLEVGLAVLV